MGLKAGGERDGEHRKIKKLDGRELLGDRDHEFRGHRAHSEH